MNVRHTIAPPTVEEVVTLRNFNLVYFKIEKQNLFIITIFLVLTPRDSSFHLVYLKKSQV